MKSTAWAFPSFLPMPSPTPSEPRACDICQSFQLVVDDGVHYHCGARLRKLTQLEQSAFRDHVLVLKHRQRIRDMQIDAARISPDSAVGQQGLAYLGSSKKDSQ